MQVTLLDKRTNEFVSFKNVESISISNENKIEINYSVTNIMWDGHTDRLSLSDYQLTSVNDDKL